MSKVSAGIAFSLILVIASACYMTRLSVVPAYLMHDEVNFSLQAHAIATSGHDTNGRLLPVYFSETGFEAGRDPLMIYWTAAWLAVWPLSDTTARLPTAALGVISVALMFLAARRMRSDGFGLLAAGLLALTPGFFTNARLALSITYGIPFVLLWLWCLERGQSSRDGRWWFAAGVCLGAGIYSYLASMILMPMLIAAALALLMSRRRRPEAAAMSIGFALLLLPLAAWLFFHPDRFTNIAAAYAPNGDNAITLRDRLTAFWMFFNPDYLFISGDGRMTNSTRVAGLFPLAFIVLIPIGLHRMMRRNASLTETLVVAGFLIAPLATAASGRLDINRVLLAIPFGVLAAAAGATELLSRKGAARAIGGLLIVGVVVQFAGVLRYYHGEYRTMSGAWFGGDHRAAVNAALDLVAARPAPQVYLDARTPIERYWRFYAAARSRNDLAEAPHYYDSNQPALADALAGAVVVCEGVEASCRGLDERWSLTHTIPRVDGAVTHRIYERLR